MTDLKQKNSGASFAVKDAKAGSVFVPVPYDENWKCKVNEEDVSEKVTSIGGMMTIPVKEGTNEISLHYQAKGRVSGAVISFAAILLCFSVWLLQRKGFSDFICRKRKMRLPGSYIYCLCWHLRRLSCLCLCFRQGIICRRYRR